MSILIYAESAEGKIKKVAFELASYAKKVAESMGTSVTAVIVNTSDVSELSKYGVDRVLKVSNDKLTTFNAKAYADVVKQAAEKEKIEINGRLAKPSTAVKENDVLTLYFGSKIIKVKVTSLEPKKDILMYELLQEEKRP